MGVETDQRMTTTCVQTSVRPVIGYHHQPIIGQSPMLSQSPEPAWQYGGSITAMVKQEPLDEARNDSGITSGSDGCPSASPGSDRSENNPYSSPIRNNNNPIHNQTLMGQYTNTPNYQAWYRTNFMDGLKDHNNPDTTDSVSQISNGSNGYQPSLSPKIESGDETFDTEGDLRVPKVNSHGKIKVHKCKQCDFVAYTKMDFWEHSKMHIKGDKILKCPKCPFVTEYKHHLEYHLLNHAGAKPFKCDRCDYSCVNKSMLNSHLKSHSKVYQYRCQDCLYETKYCHSLKLHLRKYKHKPAMVLNPDGSPNPLPIIDVYGTRRGPKVKKPNHNGMMQHPEGSLSPPLMEQNQPNPTLPFNPLLNPLLNQNQIPFPFPLIPGFPGTIPNPEILQNIQRIMRERFEELQRQQEPKEELSQTNPDAVLDLSKHPGDQTPEQSDVEDDDHTTTMFSNVEVVDNQHNNSTEDESPADSTMQAEKTESDSKSVDNNNKYDFSCQFCEICFNNEVMFRIHMGYHGFKSVFTCNMCGEECNDKVNFFLHIARAAH